MKDLVLFSPLLFVVIGLVIKHLIQRDANILVKESKGLFKFKLLVLAMATSVMLVPLSYYLITPENIDPLMNMVMILFLGMIGLWGAIVFVLGIVLTGDSFKGLVFWLAQDGEGKR